MNGSMTNTAWLGSTHRRCFICWNLVWIGKPGELEQIVNIPVPQIVEEITESNIPVPQIVEEIAEVSKSSIVWRSIPNLYFEEIKVFPG